MSARAMWCRQVIVLLVVAIASNSFAFMILGGFIFMSRSVIEMYTWFDGRNLSQCEVYPTRIFDTEDPDEMFKSEIAKEILKDIDHSIYIGNNGIKNDMFGYQPVEYISGGVKALLMAMKYRDLMFPMSFLGDNCAHGLYLSGLDAPTKWVWLGHTPKMLDDQIVLLPEFNIETTGKNIQHVMIYEIPDEFTKEGRARAYTEKQK